MKHYFNDTEVINVINDELSQALTRMANGDGMQRVAYCPVKALHAVMQSEFVKDKAEGFAYSANNDSAYTVASTVYGFLNDVRVFTADEFNWTMSQLDNMLLINDDCRLHAEDIRVISNLDEDVRIDYKVYQKGDFVTNENEIAALEKAHVNLKNPGEYLWNRIYTVGQNLARVAIAKIKLDAYGVLFDSIG